MGKRKMPSLSSGPAAIGMTPPSALGLIGMSAAANTCARCGLTFRMTSDLVYHMRMSHGKQRGGENAPRVSNRRQRNNDLSQ